MEIIFPVLEEGLVGSTKHQIQHNKLINNKAVSLGFVGECIVLTLGLVSMIFH